MITDATGRAMGFNFTGTFKPSEECESVRMKKDGVTKGLLSDPKFLGESFDISSPSTPPFGD